jgi:hypothetical protein
LRFSGFANGPGIKLRCWFCGTWILKDVPGETPVTAGEDARAPQGVAKCVSNIHGRDAGQPQ